MASKKSKTKAARSAPPAAEAPEDAAAAGAVPPAPRESTQALRFADDDLVEWMRANPKEVQSQRQETLRLLQKKRCSYGRHGGGLPMTLVPMVLTTDSLALLKRVSEVLDRALDKVIMAYVNDPKVREWFPYPDVPHEWIMWDPGFPKPTVINRHDAIFDGKTLKFIEFNTDNPGARAWADHYESVFKSIPMYSERLGKYWKPAERPMLKRMLEIFETYWQKYGSGGKKKPRVALSTFKEYLPGSEWEIIRDYLIEHGMEANLVDSRDFEVKGKRLLSGNVEFDILHICLRFTFYKRFPREHREFFEAIKNRYCLTVNPFRAAIGSQKEGMSFMTNPENHHWFDAEEVEAIKNHVPWTRRMDETVTLDPEGRDISLIEYAIKAREDLVLKITTGAGGYEVYVGKACDKSDWENAVEGASGSPEWILQQVCPIPEYELPVLHDGQVKMEKKLVNVNPYVFDGDYVGSIARVSNSSVINVAAGGGIMPVFEAV